MSTFKMLPSFIPQRDVKAFQILKISCKENKQKGDVTTALLHLHKKWLWLVVGAQFQFM